MRLKVYQAPNIGAAMTLVRDELGPDALILASRQIDGGFEITAAHEQAQQASAPQPQNHDAALRWHGVPATLASRMSDGDLMASLAQMFTFAALPCRPAAQPLLIVGPPGAGKTTTTARLATQLKLADQAPHVISADGRRAGAAEQLAAFTRLLSLTLVVADTPQQLTRAVARRPEDAPTLIDMPGLNPADPADREYLETCREATAGAIALVLPAGLDPAEAADLALAFQELGATHLIATRLDLTRRLGGILSAAATGLALSEAGIGAGIADGMIAVTPAFLAERLVATAAALRGAAPSTVSPLAMLARSRSTPTRTAP